MNTASHIQHDTKRAFATLWSWLRRSVPGSAPAIGSSAAPLSTAASQVTGAVLPFPLRGEALLVRLAELLRRRVAELVPQSDRLSLTLSHRPLLRLSIDDSAFVEFDARNAEFDLVIEASGGTRMIIQTVDFDAVVKFVLQYVVEKLSDEAMLEAAS